MKEVITKNGEMLQPLNGNSQEIAQQLIEIAKNRKLTAEDINALTPISKEVLQSIGTALKDSVINANSTSDRFFTYFEKQMDLYSEMIKDGNLSEDNKKLICNELSKAAGYVNTYAHETTKGWQYLSAFLTAILGVFLVIITIMLGGKNDGSKIIGDHPQVKS